LYHDPTPSDARIAPPQVFSELHIQTATITVNYVEGGNQDGYTCYPWPQEAKAAFGHAVDVWESLINSAVPIRINACWTDLGEGILGSSRTTTIYRDFPGAPTSGTWYQASLAHALNGSDLNESDGEDFDGDGSDADAEMNIAYSRGYDWYFGTDGEPPTGETDFASVVLHEICHGLGFAGSMVMSGPLGYWGWGQDSHPAVYDRFAEEGGGGSGTLLLSYANGSFALGSALTSGNVFFDGPNANAGNGGSPAKLYTPSEWVPGSSYSHLDYQTFNDTENQLMVYAISSGESVHSPGDVTLGMLQDLGWTVNEGPAAPVVSGIVPSSGTNSGVVNITNLSGSNFQSGATVKLGKSGQSDIDATNVTVVSPSKITCDFDLTGVAVGLWDVIVRNPDPGGQSAQLNDGFRVRAGDLDNFVYLPLVLRVYTSPGAPPSPTPSPTPTATPTATPPGDWVTIVSEDFEGSFPNGVWEVRDNRSWNGRYYWGKRDCRSSGGSFSAWSVGAGDAVIECGSDYPLNVEAYMIYGPFNLADATAAELRFDWWSKTEPVWDMFAWGASIDGTNYGVHSVSGNHASWTTSQVLDLSAVPDLGNVLGEDEVWIAFVFRSDLKTTDKGAFVDNIVLRKYTGSSPGMARISPASREAKQPDQELRTTTLRLDR
jgi:hypothetical protein